MLKYADTDVTFQEVPDETTLCINIANCPFLCEGCHSPHLREDIGVPLSTLELHNLILGNKGITCVCFMGGDAEPNWIDFLAEWAKKENPDIKVAWYSGRQDLYSRINLKHFDFIKLGPYNKDAGGLNVPTTNQVFYRVEHPGENLVNETYKFQKI